MATSRRLLAKAPKLIGRAYQDSVKELQDYLNKLWDAWANSIPPGFKSVTPTVILAGVSPSAGTDLDGWMAANAVLGVSTGTPVDIGAVNTEGSAGSLARSDHIHAVGAVITGLIATAEEESMFYSFFVGS